jgi:hypothetical protein
MYSLKTGILTLMVMLAGCGSAPKEGAIKLPMEVVDGAPVIELTVDGGGPYRFVLDTGASMGVILPVLAKEVGFEGPLIPGRRVMLERVLSDTLNLGDMEVAIFDFPLPGEAKGIIGMRTFADYLMELNYPEKQLTLMQGELRESVRTHTIPYELTPVVTINITIGKQAVPVHLDTGSPAFCSIPDTVASGLKFGTSLREVGRARIPGKEVTVRRGQLDGELVVAGYSFTNPVIDVATLMGPYGNIGYAFLNDKILILDQKNKLLRIRGNN